MITFGRPSLLRLVEKRLSVLTGSHRNVVFADHTVYDVAVGSALLKPSAQQELQFLGLEESRPRRWRPASTVAHQLLASLRDAD